MARKPLRPLIRSGGFYPSKKWTPLVYAGGYTTANGGGEPEPPPIEKTITGNPIHITDALAKPAQALSVKLEPIQDLNGYDNPWPSGGGVNIANPYSASTAQQGVTFSGNGDCSCSLSGIASGMYPQVGTLSPYDFLPHGTPLTLSTSSSGNVPSGAKLYAIVYERDTPTGANLKTYSSKNGPVTFTISHPYQLLVLVAEGNGLDYTGTNTTIYYQIEKGSTPTAWAPYSNICPITGHSSVNVIVSTSTNPLDGAITKIPLGQTVYGGTLDVTSGVLTVTHKYITIDNNSSVVADLSWNPNSPCFYLNLGGANKGYWNGTSAVADIISDTLKQTSYTILRTTAAPYFVAFTGQGGIIEWSSPSADLDTEKTRLSTTPINIVYRLATPQTIQLTPQQVELLLGENNLWSDGEMTLVYLADGNASDVEALNILLGNRYVNNHEADEPTDREALNIILGGNER